MAFSGHILDAQNFYYLASTTPTLAQTVESYFRGGVKLTNVVALVDGGVCHMATTPGAKAVLNRES